MCGLGGTGVRRSWLFGNEWGVGRRSVGWRPPESGETDTNPTEIASAPGLARQSNPQRLLWHPVAAGRQRLPRNLPTISPAPIVLRGSAAWPAPWSDGGGRPIKWWAFELSLGVSCRLWVGLWRDYRARGRAGSWSLRRGSGGRWPAIRRGGRRGWRRRGGWRRPRWGRSPQRGIVA